MRRPSTRTLSVRGRLLPAQRGQRHLQSYGGAARGRAVLVCGQVLTTTGSARSSPRIPSLRRRHLQPRKCHRVQVLSRWQWFRHRVVVLHLRAGLLWRHRPEHDSRLHQYAGARAAGARRAADARACTMATRKPTSLPDQHVHVQLGQHRVHRLLRRLRHRGAWPDVRIGLHRCVRRAASASGAGRPADSDDRAPKRPVRAPGSVPQGNLQQRHG